MGSTAHAARSPWNALLFSRWPGAVAPYAYGSRFLRYLTDTLGDSVIPRFVEALVRGKGEMVNGSRMVYPMEGQAMRFLNLVANKAFAAYYVLNGKPGLVVYELQADGSLKGYWTIADTQGAGTENLYPR